MLLSQILSINKDKSILKNEYQIVINNEKTDKIVDF